MLKRFFVLFLLAGAAVASVAACSEYDDSSLRDEIESLKDRVSALEKDVAAINGDVEALQKTLKAITDQDVVTNIRSIVENGQSGWEITYRDNGTVKIFLSREGIAPRVGVTTVNGVLCWTVDGEVLKDSAGKPVSATGPKGETGTTPQFKIEDGYWYVSYEDGKWVKLDKSYDPNSLFRSVELEGGNLVITLSDGTVLTVPVLSISQIDFDDAAVVLSLGAISDTHIGNGYGSEAKFTKALNMLKTKAAEKDADGLDGVLIAGDLVNTATNSQISTLKSLYEGVFNPVTVPMIYTIGNHDMNPQYRWTEQTVSQNAVFHSLLGDNYFLTDQDQSMRKNFECRHCVVGNYHIIAVTPNSTSPIVYDANTLTWLNKTLKDITEANPNQYVVLITHPMIYNTVYGSLLQDTYTTLGEYWSTKALSSILEGYPQVVTFGGHLHFPLNDPRSVWQGKFTSFGCASTSYMAIENGGYEDMKSATVMNDAGEFSQGLLVQFDAYGAMRVTRMDFYNSAVIGKPWDFKAPAGDLSHLETMNHTALKAANSAPTLSTMDIKNNSPVTFAAGTDDEFVHHYELSLAKNGSTVLTKKILADFYRVPQPSLMKDSYTVSLGSLSEGDYTATLVAYDSWDAASSPLVKEFTISSTNIADVTPYLGTYSLNSKIFESGKSTIQSGSVDVTFSASGQSPNNILISGLYQDAVVPARLAVDSASGAVSLGLYFDGAKGQQLSTPVSQDGTSYPYIAFLPGLGTQFISGNYNFKPCPITSADNYVWWWGTASSDGKTFSFNNDNKQSLVNSGTSYYIIAISCVLSNSENLSASSLASTWNKVYQANPGNDLTTGMTFTKK
ncbi:MAG: metallophosphoesterase [Bacteroidales bacterium]|nr:metallophosphoesterase [Bacteroidales bacterium]